MYIPKYFKLYELLPRKFYKDNIYRGDQLFQMFDDRLLWTNDQLRKRFGKIVLNDWYWGGLNQYRGFRPPDCTIGARLSQHRFGRAFDNIFIDIDVEEVRLDVLDNTVYKVGISDFQYITCVEINVSWFHFDCRNWDVSKHGILKIKP